MSIIQEQKLFEDWLDTYYEDMELSFSEDGGDFDYFDEFLREEFDYIISNLFETAQCEGTNCEFCEYNEVTKDAYGTGDSPTMRECTTSEPSDCYFVLDNLDERTDNLIKSGR